MSQIGLPLDWPEPEREDAFVLSDANAAAVRHLEHWGTWAVPITVLIGPRKSGRSLIGRLFAAKTGGRLIDDAWREAEETVFHAWNEAMASRKPLLLIADEGGWAPALPDLASRLSATPVARILPPDDALMHALIERGLVHRGLAASPQLLRWLASRIERSYASVGDAIERLDRAALTQRRRLTIAFAREALAKPRAA